MIQYSIEELVFNCDARGFKFVIASANTMPKEDIEQWVHPFLYIPELSILPLVCNVIKTEDLLKLPVDGVYDFMHEPGRLGYIDISLVKHDGLRITENTNNLEWIKTVITTIHISQQYKIIDEGFNLLKELVNDH